MNLIAGDRVEWKEGVFGGSYKNPKFLGERQIKAVILKDSYGKERGSHTLSLEVLEAEGYEAPAVETKIRRKAATIYQKAISHEIGEKHEEGASEKAARAEKQAARNRCRCGGHWTDGFCSRCGERQA